ASGGRREPSGDGWSAANLIPTLSPLTLAWALEASGTAARAATEIKAKATGSLMVSLSESQQSLDRRAGDNLDAVDGGAAVRVGGGGRCRLQREAILHQSRDHDIVT